MIYLFSSVPPDRPAYKRGVLDALCYPSGHRMEISYQRRYVAPLLIDRRSELREQPAAFVFVDYNAQADHNFVPIRRAKILGFGPKEDAALYSATSRFYVQLELGELIHFDEPLNEAIKSIAGRPVPYREQARPGDYFYMLEAGDVLPQHNILSQRDIWDGLVEKASHSKSLTNCIFLSTGHIRKHSDGDACLITAFGLEDLAYRILPNTVYKLNLRIYDRRKASIGTQEIVVRSSSDLLSVSQAFPTTLGGSAEYSVVIVCKRSIERSVAALILDVRELMTARAPGDRDEAGQAAGEPTSDVICAKPQYLLSISPPRLLVVVFVIFVFFGILLTSTSKEFFDALNCVRSVLWAPLAKVLGAASLASAAYIAFRKLPSGGSGG